MANGADDLARVALLAEAAQTETPAAGACLKIARASFALGDDAAGYAWLRRVADGRGPFAAWSAAAALYAKQRERAAPPRRRAARVAIAGTYTTSQLGPLLQLAALRRGVDVELYEVGFDLYTQEILDPASGLYAFAPDYLLLAPHDGAIHFPPLADDPEETVDAEVRRWVALWDAVRERTTARILQHNVAIRPESAWGHVSARVPGTRDELLRTFNTRLAAAAGDDVLVVDCDRIAGAFGKTSWFDDRYYHLAKQAVALDALPELARHTAAVLAGAEGLSSKCVVLDLDNTLWGGVIAEDGLEGIALGGGSPKGEAYTAFQEHLRALRARGVLLAVVSKNNDADAREPFERHPDMRLSLDDIAVFVANWDDKASNIRRVAADLDIGLDSLVFVDDNPAEREVVRQLVPEVEVLTLPSDPARYVRALADSLLFELASVTREDLGRAAQYRARAQVASLEREAPSLEAFYRSLGMRARLVPFDDVDLPRIAQLVGKTNQFNLTTRRHGLGELQALADDPDAVTMSARLRDNFVDHGLIGVLVARREGDALDIDTWLMSCRVIGRTVEEAMLGRLCEQARERGVSRLRGTYLPTPKNAVVRDLYARLGFAQVSEDEGGATRWEYDIERQGVAGSAFIGPWSDVVAHA
jgi:FkbH-like protein